MLGVTLLLMLQMQGMFAEYERAKIIERNWRGKLFRAKSGSVNVLSGAPYGYRYIRKQLTGEPAHYVVELEQAKHVREIFNWIGVERVSLGEVSRRLLAAGVPTKTGKIHWNRSVIWKMLQNPAYMGKAAFGKTKAGKLKPSVRPAKHSSEAPKKPYSIERTNPEQWLQITVPAIINEQLYEVVQSQLEENRKRARVGVRGAAHLLQGLVVCQKFRGLYF